MISKNLVTKLFAGIFLGLIGLVFGSWAGGLFVNIGIAENIAWEAGLTFLGGVAGFFLGVTYEE